VHARFAHQHQTRHIFRPLISKLGSLGKSMTVFSLFSGDVHLGTLTHDSDEMPWHIGTFRATPAFEEVCSLFDQELASLNAGRMDEWDCIQKKIALLGLRLEQQGTGLTIHKFLLHIQGAKAWWR
jgi:hypothetical protein